MAATNIKTRIEAYHLMRKLKEREIPQADLLKRICRKFQVPYGTIYDWYKYNNSPFGKRKLQYNKELFYVLGALLGDGCAYYWEKGDKHMVIIVGEKEFIDKYSDKLSKCTGKIVKRCVNRNQHIWQHKTCI